MGFKINLIGKYQFVLQPNIGISIVIRTGTHRFIYRIIVDPGNSSPQFETSSPFRFDVLIPGVFLMGGGDFLRVIL